MKEKVFIGVDWGGTRIKCGLVSGSGVALVSKTVSLPKDASFAVIVDLIIDHVRDLAAKQQGPVDGIGLALTGPVDPNHGVVYLPGKIDGLEGYPLVPRFREVFGTSVFATNDGLAAMFAEKHVGHARSCRYAVAVTLGTGVGSGVMVDGRIPDDPHFMFGTQIGHLVINTSDDRLCLTGARGTGEMNCSATALALAVRSGLQRGIPSRLSETYWKNPHAIDFETIIREGVEQGDRLCCDEFRRWTSSLGWLLVSAVHAYSPEVLILSGGATLAQRHFLPQLKEHVAQSSFRYPKDREIPVLISELKEYSGVVGAAMMCKEKCHD
jgi:glucokinase